MVIGMNKKDKVERKRFNHSFILALDCYMPSVALSVLKSCKKDIELFGFEYAQRKWKRFVVNSLTGGV